MREYWPHAPLHKIDGQGMYIVTAGTYGKKHYLNSSDRLSAFQDLLFSMSLKYGWRLQAWAIMSNHYHIVSRSPEDASNLGVFIAELHQKSASVLNAEDKVLNRKVWYQFWDTHLTFQKSYLARLKYVNENPKHHGFVERSEDYYWCSAAWFKSTAGKAFNNSVERFKTDSIKVFDDFN